MIEPTAQNEKINMILTPSPSYKNFIKRVFVTAPTRLESITMEYTLGPNFYPKVLQTGTGKVANTPEFTR